jgi:hypothetical protein
MATMRIRLRYEGEEIEAGEELYKLLPYQVSELWVKVETDLAMARDKSARARGQLKYLRNLERVKHALNRGKERRGGNGTSLTSDGSSLSRDDLTSGKKLTTGKNLAVIKGDTYVHTYIHYMGQNTYIHT